ncbi:MAG: hypothetical protein JOZ49_03560 [Mycolicibacterium sp.]|nr:hypothetical protein [Mycolicibacterium sp.]
MVERVVAAADLFTGIPSMWSDGRVTVGIIVLAVGAIIAACTLHKGVGKAIGVFIGACILAALVLGSSGILASVKHTTDNHGGITAGDYGR